MGTRVMNILPFPSWTYEQVFKWWYDFWYFWGILMRIRAEYASKSHLKWDEMMTFLWRKTRVNSVGTDSGILGHFDAYSCRIRIKITSQMRRNGVLFMKKNTYKLSWYRFWYFVAFWCVFVQNTHQNRISNHTKWCTFYAVKHVQTELERGTCANLPKIHYGFLVIEAS